MLKNRYAVGVWNRFFFANVTTRAALPWTSLFVALRLRPNHVSTLAFLVSCAGVAILVLGGTDMHRWIAAGLLLLSLVWDHSDGQVARRTGTGSVLGGLIDSIFDRFVEMTWIVGIGLDAMLHPERGLREWPAWSVLAVTCTALFADLYVRWATALKNLAPLHQALKRAFKQTPEGGEITIKLGPAIPKGELGRVFGLPLYFGRDISIWLLAAVAVLPDPLIGLAVFAAAHLLRGLELNWYTRSHLRNDTRAVWKVLDPDYH